MVFEDREDEKWETMNLDLNTIEMLLECCAAADDPDCVHARALLGGAAPWLVRELIARVRLLK